MHFLAWCYKMSVSLRLYLRRKWRNNSNLYFLGRQENSRCVLFLYICCLRTRNCFLFKAAILIPARSIVFPCLFILFIVAIFQSFAFSIDWPWPLIISLRHKSLVFPNSLPQSCFVPPSACAILPIGSLRNSIWKSETFLIIWLDFFLKNIF